MKVLVDTSVWIDFFNEFSSPEAQLLTRLIEDEVEIVTCGVILAEFFQGIRQTQTLPDLELHFQYLSYVAPQEPGSYLAAARLFRELRRQGITIRSIIDCLIAILAEEHDLFLLAKDRDMVTILQSDACSIKHLPLA